MPSPPTGLNIEGEFIRISVTCSSTVSAIFKAALSALATVADCRNWHHDAMAKIIKDSNCTLFMRFFAWPKCQTQTKLSANSQGFNFAILMVK